MKYFLFLILSEIRQERQKEKEKRKEKKKREKEKDKRKKKRKGIVQSESNSLGTDTGKFYQKNKTGTEKL